MSSDPRATLDPRDPAYWRAGKVPAPAWPDSDPAPEVTNRDPRPADAPEEPKAVRDLRACGIEAGYEVRVGYSRGNVRAVKVGTYKRVETFGVWAGLNGDWRWSAMYSRTVGTKTWTWDRVTLWRPVKRGYFGMLTVTDLREFLSVRGSVPAEWFTVIREREEAKRSKAKAAAKERPAKGKPKEEVS